jgi:hypothetical protein
VAGRRAGPTGCRAVGQVTSAQAMRLLSGWMVAPVRSVTSATMARPQPLPAGKGCAPGPSSAISTRAQRGAVRTRRVNVPPWPLAEWMTALLASSLTARTRSSTRGQPVSASRANRRARPTASGVPGSVAVRSAVPPRGPGASGRGALSRPQGWALARSADGRAWRSSPDAGGIRRVLLCAPRWLR